MVNEIFKNRFRIPSARATWHNYNAGTYFVTICTQNREHCFGEIVTDGNGEPKMVLSEIGGYAQQQIKNAKIHYPYAEIPLWVVMPNHVHVIVIIRNYDTDDVHDDCRDAINRVSTGGGITHMNNPMIKKCLGTIIRGLKARISRYAHDHAIPFAWQTRFHDHIVRNTDELNRIATYVQNNVAQWESDKYHDSL